MWSQTHWTECHEYRHLQSLSLKAHRLILTSMTKYFSMDISEALKKLFLLSRRNTFVNWTRLEQDSNSSFTETFSKLLRRIWTTNYALLSAKRFLNRRHWFGQTSQTQKFPFSKPQLSHKQDIIYSVKFSARGHISSLPRLPRTKPKLEVGVRLLSYQLVISSTEEHQDLI